MEGEFRKEGSKDFPPPFGSGREDARPAGPKRVFDVPLGSADAAPTSGDLGEGGMIMGPDHPIFQSPTVEHPTRGRYPDHVLPP